MDEWTWKLVKIAVRIIAVVVTGIDIDA